MIVMKFSAAVGALVGVSALLLVAACGGGTASAGPATDGRLTIVTAFYPFQFIAEHVAGDHAVVTSLTQPGAEPHDLELTPRQVGSISDADLVVYEHSFQAAVDEAVQQSGNASTLDTATVVPLQDLGTEAEEGTGSRDRYLDPHVWLDPVNVATIATAVATRLTALDPAHAADYRRNAAALKTELATLDHRYRSGLSSCRRNRFITQHAAFGYLARRYHLTQIAIGGLSPDTEPSPARIARVQQEARSAGVTTIFYETLVSPAVARSVAGDLGLRTDVLDPVEGITAASRGQDYLAVMQSNLTALETADGC